MGVSQAVKTLVDNGVSPNSVDDDGTPAIFYAAELDYLPIFELLARAGPICASQTRPLVQACYSTLLTRI